MGPANDQQANLAQFMQAVGRVGRVQRANEQADVAMHRGHRGRHASVVLLQPIFVHKRLKPFATALERRPKTTPRDHLTSHLTIELDSTRPLSSAASWT